MKLLKEDVNQKIKESNKAKAKLAYVFDVTGKTIDRWIEGNDIRLTTDAALDVISQELGLDKNELIAA